MHKCALQSQTNEVENRLRLLKEIKRRQYKSAVKKQDIVIVNDV